MAVKTTYTDAEVQDYMGVLLGDTAKKLNLSVADGDFQDASDSVLYSLEQDDYTFVTTRDLAAEVRAVAKVEAWRMAMHNTAHLASHSVGAPGTGSTSRQNVHEFCKTMYEMAQQELAEKFPDSLAVPSSTFGARALTAWQVGYQEETRD